jgi:hypothetical protein
MKLRAKYFFLDILFLGGQLNFDKYIFPWHTCFSWVAVFDCHHLAIGYAQYLPMQEPQIT